MAAKRGRNVTGSTPREAYRSWKRSFDVGCVFARYLAVKPKEFGQRLEVVDGDHPVRLAGKIERRVGKLVNAAATQTAVGDGIPSEAIFLFPDVVKLHTLVEIAGALDSRPGWHVKRWLEANTPGGRVVAFGMARDVPLASGRLVPSEVLIAGPFDEFPKTRRAPVTGFEVFVGTPSEKDLDGNDRKKANLADVPVDIPQPIFGRNWDQTRKDRRKVLGVADGEDDVRAKARVAFVIPETLATSLGVTYAP